MPGRVLVPGDTAMNKIEKNPVLTRHKFLCEITDVKQIHMFYNMLGDDKCSRKSSKKSR